MAIENAVLADPAVVPDPDRLAVDHRPVVDRHVVADHEVVDIDVHVAGDTRPVADAHAAAIRTECDRWFY